MSGCITRRLCGIGSRSGASGDSISEIESPHRSPDWSIWSRGPGYSVVVPADPDRERRFDVGSAKKLNAEGEVLLPLGLTEKQQTRSFQPVRGL